MLHDVSILFPPSVAVTDSGGRTVAEQVTVCESAMEACLGADGIVIATEVRTSLT